jgi:hypothetical protein
MTRFLIIIIGVMLIIVGLMWPFIQKLGLGHLPGDIVVKRENFTFYFPLTTSIIFSLVLTGIYYCSINNSFFIR